MKGSKVENTTILVFESKKKKVVRRSFNNPSDKDGSCLLCPRGHIDTENRIKISSLFGTHACSCFSLYPHAIEDRKDFESPLSVGGIR